VASRAVPAALISRFALAGVANTALGLLVIAALDLGLGVNPHLANAAGYAAGLALSFQLNRRFVFRATASLRETGPRFVVAALCAFALNQIVLVAAQHLLGASDPARAIAQLFAVATYTVTLFLICRFWAFETRPRPEGQFHDRSA
jgi:putative flippase GtrA